MQELKVLLGESIHAHAPSPQDLISLENRRPFSAISQLAPWDMADLDHVNTCPTLNGVSKKNPHQIKQKTEEALTHVGQFDLVKLKAVVHTRKNNSL